MPLLLSDGLSAISCNLLSLLFSQASEIVTSLKDLLFAIPKVPLVNKLSSFLLRHSVPRKKLMV